MDKSYQIEIQQLHKSDVIINCTENENLLEAMIRQSIPCRSDCGGRGTCTKCKLQVTKGDLSVTIQDQISFTMEELQKGYRLSCKAYPREDIVVKQTAVDETDMEVVAESIQLISRDPKLIEEKGYAIAIDLGTTTLAISIVDRKNRRILNTDTIINPQRVYGADVISRIKASNEGKKELLRELISNCIIGGILTVIKNAGIEARSVKRISIAGNTTMGHLLMGYSCDTLGLFPFKPVNNSTIEVKLKDIKTVTLKGKVINSEKLNIVDINLLRVLQEVPVVLIPGISTFVGGDIVAGLSFCGFDKIKKPCLLIDLGTNGEMALGNHEWILVTSTAAGPAFEGGNISCGMGSVPGAISSIVINEKLVTVGTIGNQPPVGICGTGVVEIASELFKAGLMDETGLLIDEYFKEGFPILQGLKENRGQDDASKEIYFTQKDIRELQLAKAAIRAGIEILIKNYGITIDQIDQVFLAGGFGFKLDVDKAILIGLLPEKFRDRITVVGNSSLAGAITYLTESDTREKIERILSVSEEIHLSNDDDFYELYLNCMSFQMSQ